MKKVIVSMVIAAVADLFVPIVFVEEAVDGSDFDRRSNVTRHHAVFGKPVLSFQPVIDFPDNEVLDTDMVLKIKAGVHIDDCRVIVFPEQCVGVIDSSDLENVPNRLKRSSNRRVDVRIDIQDSPGADRRETGDRVGEDFVEPRIAVYFRENLVILILLGCNHHRSAALRLSVVFLYPTNIEPAPCNL